MSNFKLKFNQEVFRKKFAQHLDSDLTLKVMVNNFARKIFDRAHNQLMKEFNEHPITQELKEGPGADNISLTLDGHGNLFAFLGFFDTQTPTEELEIALQNIEMQRTVRRGNNVYFTITVPDKNQIQELTPLNWGSGTGWAIAVENGEFHGDATLSHFVYRSWSGGRSGKGVQVEGEYTEDEFQPRPYLSQIFDNFKNRVNGQIKI